MAVGVIVGSSFTAIVNGMSNFILKPVINWILAEIFGAESLSEIFTVLKPVTLADGTLDLENSIYINWGEFINTVLNFLIVAFVLFCIVKLINSFRDMHKELDEQFKKNILTKEDKRVLKSRGVKLSDRKAVDAYLDEKEQEEKAKAEAIPEFMRFNIVENEVWNVV